MDGSCQGIHIKGQHIMGQNSSKVIGIVYEDTTDDHIINKLCRVCAWLWDMTWCVLPMKTALPIQILTIPWPKKLGCDIRLKLEKQNL